MKKQTIAVLTALIITALTTACGQKTLKDYPIKPVPFTNVHFEDDFWLPRLETNRTVTIPYALEQCEETGRIKNFEVAAGQKEGGFSSAYPFDDSDVYKIVEGASYALKVHPDPELEKKLDEVIAKIGAAQEEDGYLYTARTIFPHPPKVRWVDTEERWSNMFLGHELYNAGHMYEAAAAHFQATGKRSFLDIALKNADLVVSVFGPDKKTGVPGHQEIEIGLVKLYRITGEKKYLDLAKFFLDERGRPRSRELYGEYSQDHKPVIEQKEPVGHAVRAAYMYSGMADVAALTGDEDYRDALETIWTHVVSKKMYITGGIGSQSGGESFGDDYELPNATAYCETCAAIANAFWNHRMFLLSGDARYLDVLERVIYNNVLSGISLDGNRFFYPNPLESRGQHQRSPWFNCACCPSNLTRFIPSVPGYVYAVRDNNLYINLFVQSASTINMEKQTLRVRQRTSYPWDGLINIEVDPEKSGTFTVFIRIPGWARNRPVPSGLYRYAQDADEKAEIHVCGEPFEYGLEQGFAAVTREWKHGDAISVNLPMPIRRVLSHDRVEANEGRAALERGPIVYCAEGVDNQGFVSSLFLRDDDSLESSFKEDLLKGVVVLTGNISSGNVSGTGAEPGGKRAFTAVPYYGWAHRGPGEMLVWMAREKSKIRLPGSPPSR